MQSETKNCQNCKSQFTIELDDFGFYEKIGVPAPTWCPECRQMRRYAWRNEKTLYRRTCDLCGKSTVTIYSQDKPFKVYCPPCWWSDKWSALDFGRDFDFARPFFEQFKELQLQVPRIALLTKNSVNSEYTNHCDNNKNCFRCYSVFNCEDILYSNNIWKNAKNCMECYHLDDGAERCFECMDSFRIYRCQYGMKLRDCMDCHYCYDCRGSSNCFLCSNLRNKQYCILNEQYSKEEYAKKLEEFRLGSHVSRKELYGKFLSLLKDTAIHAYAEIERSVDVTGNIIFNSKNSQHIFDADDTEDSKYAIICPSVKNTMDAYHYGFACELIYECHALIRNYSTQFSHLCYDDSYTQYSDDCHNCQNIFGCVGVKQGKYCIFNKVYGEKEYAELRAKMIAHMKDAGEYGEFFPPQLSPFGYNETQGQVYMPLSKEQALARGFRWEDKVLGTFGKESIQPDAIPDDIKDIPDTITKEVLACVICKKNYNIVQPELDFYRRETLPVPHLCPDCRYMARIALRPPRKLWKRVCMCNHAPLLKEEGSGEVAGYQNTATHSHGINPCPNEFETSYSPGRPEIVYCEQCYQAEVS